jgi:hypothetical protein
MRPSQIVQTREECNAVGEAGLKALSALSA